METQQPSEHLSASTEYISRRDIVHQLGAGGIAVALLATGLSRTGAQDAAPTPTSAVGVTAEILSRAEADAAPGYALQLVRLTFAPEGSIAPHTHPGDTITYQESGSLGFTVLDGEASLVRAGTATPETGPAGEVMEINREYTIAPGDALALNAQTVHSARNATGEPAVALEVGLRQVGMPQATFLGTPVP